MNKTTFTIKGEFTSQNEYFEAERTHRYLAAKIKLAETTRVAWEARAQKIKLGSGKYFLSLCGTASTK